MKNNEFKPEVSVDTFYALDIRFCKIENVEDILKNTKKPFDAIDNPVKGYVLTIDTGLDKRNVVTNIIHFSKETLMGITTTFILNFPEIIIRGIKSKGMIFMTSENTLLTNGTLGQVVI